MTNRFGAYYLGSPEPTLPELTKLSPAWVVILNPELKHVEMVRKASPHTKVAARYYRSDQDYSNGINSDPIGYAKNVIDEVRKNQAYEASDLLITSNEVCMGWEEIGNLNRFYLALQKLWAGSLGLYSTPVESIRWDKEPYDESLAAYISKLIPSMSGGLDRGDIFCAHQYNSPQLWLPGMEDKRLQDNLNYNRIVRYEQHIWPLLSSDLQQLPVLMSEWGWDFLEWPTHRHGGWLDPDGPADAHAAMREIVSFSDMWDAKYHDVPVVGWVPYCVQDSGGWELYRFDKNKGQGATLLQMMADVRPGGIWPIRSHPVHDKPPVRVHTPKPHKSTPESTTTGGTVIIDKSQEFKSSMTNHLNRMQKHINDLRRLAE